MYHVIQSSRGMPVIMPCEQPDAVELGRAASLENAKEIVREHVERIGGRRLATVTVLCASLVALVSGLLL